MLDIKQLHVRYDQHQVLHGITLSLEKGLIHGLVGLNGAGKTTLLDAIYGLVRPSEGDVLWEGEATLQKIGYLETHNFVYSNITAREHLQLFPNGSAFFSLERWQTLLHLPLDELVENYSTGMKKKLALLCILKLNRPFLILDEPFNGLDLETVKLLNIIILQLKAQGKTILITSHIIETLTSCCDYIHLLTNGNIAKTYLPSSYSTIDDDLFGKMEKETNEALKEMLRQR
ncbi:MAG: ABC-type transporter ATP-binding protein EcsA [Bacteroidota bacterium]|jgi:ABC-2 type transport system ATP-binding protein